VQSAVEKNAKVIKEHIEELYASTGKKVVLLGHSKGRVDASAACSMYWPQLRDKVIGCILVQSPCAGTPIVSDILREGQIAERTDRKPASTTTKETYHNNHQRKTTMALD
jgi:hypothetical protein